MKQGEPGNWAQREANTEKSKASIALDKAKELEKQRMQAKTHKWITAINSFSGKPEHILKKK